jgi:ATP synthase protein I
MDTIPHPVRKPADSPATPWVNNDVDSDGVADDDFKPLTREQAQQWRSTQPTLSVRLVLVWQVVVALVMTALSYLFTGDSVVVQSVFYGAAAVVLPSALMAWGVTSSAVAKKVSGVAQASLLNFFVWEGVKLALVMALLGLAPVLLDAVNWLALVAGLVLVLKVVGLVFFIQSKRRR